jgi:predicted component of type VI protein secretion system
VFAVPVRIASGRRIVRVCIGPLERSAFAALRPVPGTAFAAFARLTRLYLGDGPTFDVELRLRAADVAAWNAATPGWDSFADTPGREAARDGVVRMTAWQYRRAARTIS